MPGIGPPAAAGLMRGGVGRWWLTKGEKVVGSCVLLVDE